MEQLRGFESCLKTSRSCSMLPSLSIHYYSLWNT